MFSARAYFLVAIPLMATAAFKDDPLIDNYYYPYFVQFLFSLTNGIMTSNFLFTNYLDGCFI
jgi:hypothetical protein